MVRSSPVLLIYRDRAAGGLIIGLTVIGLAMAYAPARPEPPTAQAAPVIIIATPPLSRPDPPTPVVGAVDHAPSAALAAATVAPPATEPPATAEPQIVYVEVTAPPMEAPPVIEPPTTEPPTEAPTRE